MPLPSAIAPTACLSPVALVLAVGVCFAGTASSSDTVAVPSGQPVTLVQVLWPAADSATGARMLRFRFVAPWIGKKRAGRVDIDVAGDDMQFLCDHVALPALKRDGRKVDGIVISLMARHVTLGEAVDVPQFFDGYRPAGDHCEWEGL